MAKRNPDSRMKVYKEGDVVKVKFHNRTISDKWNKRYPASDLIEEPTEEESEEEPE